MYDVIIIGGGPAGLTAAIYTGRARLRTLILEGSILGGNAALTDFIDNYPGFPFGIQGSELMEKFLRQAQRFGAEVGMEMVLQIEPDQPNFLVKTNRGEYKTRAVIIAGGVRRRELEVPGEKDFLGRGVSYCATCDGAFFQGSEVAVVGGGDTAVKEALYLADIASKVYLIHRRDKFRANPVSMEKLLENQRVEIKENTIIRSIEGQSLMNNLVLENVKTQEKQNLAVEGLFVSIGMISAGDFLEGVLDTREGYILTDENLQTSIPGVFAAGDIRWKKGRQVATAVGEGALAGIAATEYLKE